MPDESKITVTLPKAEYDELVRLAKANTLESRQESARRLVDGLIRLFENQMEMTAAHLLSGQRERIVRDLAQ
jgi:hypothetical protein